jgi:stearoyl-CoA desaturase (delta-9 desaturase)
MAGYEIAKTPNDEEAMETRMNWGSIFWVSLMHVGAIFSVNYLSTQNVVSLVVMYFLTGCIGITMTYHRMISHRTFVTPKWFERLCATCGALAMQGGPIKWTAIHRQHHSAPDTDMDPHSSRKGFLHCHFLWTTKWRDRFDDPVRLRRFARDVATDPYYRWLDTVAGQVIPQFILAALLYGIGGFGMVLWGVCLRMVLVYHATWCVNSATHFFGYRNYAINDLSRNTWWVALITFGEGWHNNHHAVQGVAEAGHKWWEIDPTMMVIRFFKSLGLVTRLKSIKDLDCDRSNSPVKLSA